MNMVDLLDQSQELESLQHTVANWLYHNHGFGNHPISITNEHMVQEICEKNSHQFKTTETRHGKIVVDYYICLKCKYGFAEIFPIKETCHIFVQIPYLLIVYIQLILL